MFYFLFTYSLTAQTKVSGIVVDENNDPVPFANILFVGSRVGVSSNENGKFTISSDKNYKEIEVSYVGYNTKTVALTNSTIENLRIKLQSGQNLKEVVIVTKPKKHLSKKENPAYRILQGIWANKRKNGLKLVKHYDFKRYTSVAVGLSNLDSLFLKKTMAKQYDSIVKIIKSGKKDKKFFVPIYMKEDYESVYGNNILKKERVDTEAERTVGVNQYGFLFERISNTFSEIDIYDDDIIVLNKPFVSPISTRGYGVYDYVLKDSIIENNKKTYQIYFFPRQAGTIAFEGYFKVVDKNFAISEVSMKVDKGINLNLVRNLSFEKNYDVLNDSIYLPSKDYYEGDFTLFTKNDEEKGIFVRKNIVFSDYDFELKHDNEFYYKNIIQTKANQFLKEDSYWNSVITRDPNLNATRKVIGELKDNSRIKTVSNTITALATGYFDVFKNLQFGSFWQIVSNNNVEGIRLKGGFRTFKTSDDLFRTSSYLAYGTKDHILKFGVEARYLIFKKPRIIIGASHTSDNLQLGGVTDLLSVNNETNVLIGRGQNYFLSKVEKNSLYVDWAIHNNLHISFTGIQQTIKSAAEQYFSIDYSIDGSTIKKDINDFTTNVTLTYSPHRYVYGFGVNQTIGQSYYPSLILKYIKGYKGVMGSDFNYNKIQAGYSKPIFLSNFGMLKTYFEVGKAFETLPLPLLYPVAANQSLSIVKNTFCLLNYYDLMTDAYIMGHFNYHLNGFIFNKVPYLKKLKLREILFYRTIYGTIRKENIDINKSNIIYEAPSNKLYSEFGFGIENIGYGNFRAVRVDFVWRSSFQNVNGNEAPNFGIRFGFNPEF